MARVAGHMPGFRKQPATPSDYHPFVWQGGKLLLLVYLNQLFLLQPRRLLTAKCCWEEVYLNSVLHDRQPLTCGAQLPRTWQILFIKFSWFQDFVPLHLAAATRPYDNSTLIIVTLLPTSPLDTSQTNIVHNTLLNYHSQPISYRNIS